MLSYLSCKSEPGLAPQRRSGFLRTGEVSAVGDRADGPTARLCFARPAVVASDMCKDPGGLV